MQIVGSPCLQREAQIKSEKGQIVVATFFQQSLNVYYVTGAELLVVNKTDKNSCPHGAYISAGRQGNK